MRIDEGFECDECGSRWYYTRPRCPECGHDAVSRYDLLEGELITRTVIHMTPPDVRNPNGVGFARFGNVQVIAQLSDDPVSIGDRVEFSGGHQLRRDHPDLAPRLTPINK